jgi:hypothetical protein
MYARVVSVHCQLDKMDERYTTDRRKLHLHA